MTYTRIRLPREKKAGTSPINLTSLIDIMTILLVFIVVKMGTDAITDFSSSDLTLPQSFSSRVPRNMDDMVVVSIGKQGVVVDNNPVMTTTALVASPVGIVPEIAGSLSEHWERENHMVQIGHQSEVSKWVKVLGDESLTFIDVLKVMRTCSEVGYEHVYLGATSLGR